MSGYGVSVGVGVYVGVAVLVGVGVSVGELVGVDVLVGTGVGEVTIVAVASSAIVGESTCLRAGIGGTGLEKSDEGVEETDAGAFAVAKAAGSRVSRDWALATAVAPHGSRVASSCTATVDIAAATSSRVHATCANAILDIRSQATAYNIPLRTRRCLVL